MTPSDQSRAASNGVYRPILRARRGELAALGHLDPDIAARVAPILVPQPTARAPTDEVAATLRLIRQHIAPGRRLAIELSRLPDSGDSLHSPPLDVAESLAEYGIELLPVVRATDSDRRLIEHGLAARMHADQAVVRFQRRVDAAEPVAATRSCERIWRGTGLPPGQCHLIVDLAAVGCGAHAAHIFGYGDRILRWARRHPWRSITLAAGAMPAQLTDLPTDVPVELGRFDARLWRQLRAPDVGYGDYGVAAPASGDGAHHRPLPTMRYTAEDAWWVYRWSRGGGRTDDRFYDLCRTLVTSTHWPAAGARFSWGDAEIARRARYTPGAGTPSSWLAWATSHHIAQVMQELGGRQRCPGGTVSRSARSRRPRCPGP